MDRPALQRHQGHVRKHVRHRAQTGNERPRGPRPRHIPGRRQGRDQVPQRQPYLLPRPRTRSIARRQEDRPARHRRGPAPVRLGDGVDAADPEPRLQPTDHLHGHPARAKGQRRSVHPPQGQITRRPHPQHPLRRIHRRPRRLPARPRPMEESQPQLPGPHQRRIHRQPVGKPHRRRLPARSPRHLGRTRPQPRHRPPPMGGSHHRQTPPRRRHELRHRHEPHTHTPDHRRMHALRRRHRPHRTRRIQGHQPRRHHVGRQPHRQGLGTNRRARHRRAKPRHRAPARPRRSRRHRHRHRRHRHGPRLRTPPGHAQRRHPHPPARKRPTTTLASRRQSHHTPHRQKRTLRMEPTRRRHRHQPTQRRHPRPPRSHDHQKRPHPRNGDMVLMPATDHNGLAITNPATQDAYLAVQSANITSIKGVEDDDMPTIQKLLKTWRDHYARNMLRAEYYQARYRYNGVAYSIPKEMRALAKPMIGWPNKAVRALADLNVFEGFDAPDPLQAQVDELVDDNAWDTDVSEAITSAYIHGCSFITVYEDPDEPGRILMLPRSADWSAGIWDRRRRRLGSALTITDKDDRTGRITAFTAWLPGKVYEIDDSEGPWTARTIETHLDRPSVVPLVNDAQSYHPLGNSRITRTLMNLTDFGLRTMVRMEATAEFYAAPRVWFIGASKKFTDDTWSSIVSVMNGMPANKNGDKPTMQQLQQASMTPHADMLRTIALMVSSETDIPVNDLGITMDNPASAEAMAEAERKLSRTADRQNKRFGRALKEAMSIALAYQGADPDALRELRPIWAPVKETSDAARADWYQKVASTNPDFADSDVGLTRAGLTWDEIKAHRAYERQQRTQQSIDELRARLTIAKTDEQQGANSNGNGNTDQSAAGQPQSGTAPSVPNAS
nr:MAG TPA: PORTAL PROTEIN [Caudoviricetes sp.]